MDKRVMIIVGIIVIAIIILGILAIVYYTKTKNNTSTQSTIKNTSKSVVDEKPSSLATFEEIQDDETPFPAPEEQPMQEPMELLPKEISEEIDKPEDFIEPETHQPVNTSFQPQDYEQSYYNEPKKHNPYASVGIDYNSQPADVNFQFTKQQQGEYE